MNKILFLLFLISTLLLQPTYGQSRGSLRGFVSDSSNGEVLSYASVVIEGLKKGVTTDTRGFFHIPSVPAGRQTVSVSFMGYKTKVLKVDITPNEITEIEVKLEPGAIRLEDMTVVGERSSRLTEANLGLQKISAKQIEMMPTGFEADVFKVLQTLPGVKSTGDVTSKYNVRGGENNQNLVLINGATVYNPFHVLGIYSVIDPEMISQLEFYKGGFAPEYGGRLSSILNIVTKDGNKNNYHGSASAGMLSGKASFEGPIPGGSFLVTGRKSYYSGFLKSYLNGQKAPFDFYDMSFKANFSSPAIDKNSKFIAHAFMSGDKVDNQDPTLENYTVRNMIAGINWYKVWSSPLYSNLVISSSTYDAEVIPNMSKSKPRKNSVSDITVNWNFTMMFNSWDEMDFGIQNSFLATDLKMENVYSIPAVFNTRGREVRAYLNYKYYRYEDVGINAGIRFNLSNISDKGPMLFEPRLSVTYRPGAMVSFKAAFGRYSQELTTLSDESELISIFEPWTIIPKYVAPPEASHFLVGMQVHMTDKLSMEVEGYYKFINNMMDVNNMKFVSKSNDFSNVEGESYGTEVMVKYQGQDFYFQSSYALSWTFKIVSGVKYVPRYDSRHSVNILAGYNLGKGWQVNSTWALSSGMPFTPIVGFYDRLDLGYASAPSVLYNTFKASTLWGRRNSYRLPFYHRLDLGISKKFRIWAASCTFDASILNVYDRKNIYYFERNTGKRVNMLPFLPSASFKVEL